MTPTEALHRFMAIRAQFNGAEPILRVGQGGRVVRSKEPPGDGQAPDYFCVLAYRAPEHQLARANVPFWFLKTKVPPSSTHYVEQVWTWTVWVSRQPTLRGMVQVLSMTRPRQMAVACWFGPSSTCIHRPNAASGGDSREWHRIIPVPVPHSLKTAGERQLVTH